MTDVDGESIKRARAIYYDLVRIELLSTHPGVRPALAAGHDQPAPEVGAQDVGSLQDWVAGEGPYEDALAALLEERLPAFDEWVELEEHDPEIAMTSFLDDPEQVVIHEIGTVTRQIKALQERQAFLVAYAREFTADPPRLIDIAAAAGVSRTQVTRMYGDRQVDLLVETLGLPSPRAAREALRRRDDVPPRDPSSSRALPDTGQRGRP